MLLAVLLAGGCKRTRLASGEPAYVAAPQVNVRDRLSAVYKKVAVLTNADKVEILEKNRRFVRVRTPGGQEGWMEARYLVGPEVLEGFEKLRTGNAATPVQARGLTRAELNMHVTPGRETDHLYRMPSGAKVEVLKRVTADKNPPKPVPPATPAKPLPVRA